MSGYTDDDRQYIDFARERCAAAIQRVARERDIPDEKIARWLATETGARWQTTKNWAEGKSYPRGPYLIKLAKTLGLDTKDIVPELPADVRSPYQAWGRFLETRDGKTLNDEERHVLRFFAWASEPTVDDYQTLLFCYRKNAGRSATG